MNNKLLTIAIPTYNRAPILDRALCIIQPQLENHKDNVEFIVSDNCSTDNTEEVVQRYIDTGMPVHYTRNDHNAGPAINITNCYKNAKGKYIWVLSDDDYLSENAISYVVSIIQNNKDYGFLWHSLHSPLKAGHKEYPSKKDFFSNIDYMINWICGSILRTKYVKTFPFDQYVNEYYSNWLTTAMLNIHVMLQAEYNVLIGEKIIVSAGHGGKTSGGLNIFKVVTDILILIKNTMGRLKIPHKHYERNKRIAFDGFFCFLIERILFQGNRQDYLIEKPWKILFKCYWYLPYFYIFIVRCFIKYKLSFSKKIKWLLLFLLHPKEWLQQNMNRSFLLKQLHWRGANPHNKTKLASNFEESRVFAGVKTTGDLWVFDDENSGAVLRIGNNCTIGQNVRFLLSDPSLNIMNRRGNIVLGNNVIIGRDVIVYPGVNIGNNVTVYAGSVVTETIDNNVSVSGNPAKIIISGNKEL